MYRPFMFVDDWNLSFNGRSMNISKKDLENYYENGITDEEIKSMAFMWLSKQVFFSFDEPNYKENEL